MFDNRGMTKNALWSRIFKTISTGCIISTFNHFINRIEQILPACEEFRVLTVTKGSDL